MHPDIHGLWPALLIPVTPEGALDTPRALAHARRMLDAGCDGVTLFGTTGEGPAFSTGERQALLAALLDAGVRPEQVVVTISASALPDAIALGRHAAGLGCHRQMFMPPFYFRNPPQAGVIASVSHVIDGIGDPRLKMLLYHIPGLSSVSFSHAAVEQLAQRHPGVVIGVKDSSGDLAHGLDLARAFPSLAILVGAEQHVAATMLAGGSGSINGLANIAPRLLRRIVAEPDRVSAADVKLVDDLLALLGCRPDMPFVCVYKTMLAEQTGDDGWLHVRAPLVPLAPADAQAVRSGYRAIGAALSGV